MTILKYIARILTVTGIIIMLVIISGTMQHLLARPLVKNGGFDQGATGWQVLCTTVEADYTESTYGGSNSNRVAEIDDESCFYQDVCVLPGLDYTFSMRASRRTGNGAAPTQVTTKLTIEGLNASNAVVATYVNVDFSRSNTSFGLTAVTGIPVVSVPSGSGVVRLRISFRDNTPGTSTLGMIIDDVTLDYSAAPMVSGADTLCGTAAPRTLAITGIPASGVFYRWDFGPGATPATSTAPEPSVIWNTQGTKNIRCILGNGTCDVDTLLINVYFNFIPDTLRLTLPDTSVCAGSSMLFSPDSGGITGSWSWGVLPGGDPVSSLSCTDCAAPIVTPGMTTQYTVLFRYGYCEIRDTATVTVLPLPVLDAGRDTTTCTGGTLQLDARLVRIPGNTYRLRWQPALFLNNDTLERPVTAPLSDVSYAVSVTDGNGCANSDTVQVRVLQGFDLLNPDTVICRGESVHTRIFVQRPGYEWNWMPGTQAGVSDPAIMNPVITPDSSRLYTITASYPGCPDSVRSFFVTVQEIPVVDAGTDRFVCRGDTLHLQSTVIPQEQQYTYGWTPAGALDNPTAPDPVCSAAQTTTLTLTVSTSAGCVGRDDLLITVDEAHFLRVSPDTAICPGDTVQLHVSGEGLSGFAWRSDSWLSDTANADPLVYPVTSYTYAVYGVNGSNCRDTARVTVGIHPAAVLHIPDTIIIYPGLPYRLQPSGNCLYFEWFPHSGLSAYDEANPLMDPEVNTRYFVHARTEHGCSVKDSIDVMVSDTQIDVPNVFVPGSASNSLFRVIHIGQAKLERFTVYNRWGARIFETTDINQGWDGTWNGQSQPLGVYVYVVKAVTPGGRYFYKQGNVSLIR